MIEHFLQTKITEQLPFQPTEQQAELIVGLASYLTNITPRRVFLLKGYAGTGKTSVISALVKALKQLERKTILLASHSAEDIEVLCDTVCEMDKGVLTVL